jgi:hypothetical protein
MAFFTLRGGIETACHQLNLLLFSIHQFQAYIGCHPEGGTTEGS